MATTQFEQLPTYLFESDWPNLPLKLQKYYLSMLANAQQTLHFDGFGILSVDMKSFTKVSESKQFPILWKEIEMNQIWNILDDEYRCFLYYDV